MEVDRRSIGVEWRRNNIVRWRSVVGGLAGAYIHVEFGITWAQFGFNSVGFLVEICWLTGGGAGVRIWLETSKTFFL